MNPGPPPPPHAPSPHAPPPGGRVTGAPSQVEVRVTAPDLARRASLERTRGRLVIASGGFLLLFGAVAVKLAGATVVFPMASRRLEHMARLPAPKPPVPPADTQGAAPGDLPVTVAAPVPDHDGAPHTRAQITDRNGEILAISLPTAGLFANPREMMDTAEAAAKLKAVLPRLDLEVVQARLSSGKGFVYIARGISPREQLAVNNLGIPGVYFQPTERRRYPQGRVGAHVVGGVDVDAHGVAGVERAFDERLRTDPTPLRLSLDIRVQAAMRDELLKSMTEFHAIGACGIVMDVRTGEVIAMVSLPDFDANKPGEATPEERFNRAVTGMYEPGSTFKLQTAAMSLDSGAGHLWNSYDAAHDIKIGRFTIQDFQGKHRALSFPEVIAYSSNLGAAHMAVAVGAERQQNWLRAMGMFGRIGIELPEQGQPIVQPLANWKEIATMTVGFGHGIAVSPLHVVRGTAALANGGLVLKPTILAVDPATPREPGTRVMQQSTSDTVRKLMRLVVTDGYGKPADVPGYFVGGKTGTAEKTTAHGYKKHANISAFMSVFPMNAPRYAVYFMLDEPKGNASTGGYSTAGAVSAPGAGKVISRIAPMLGLMPETVTAAATQATLAISMNPGRPAGAPANTPATPPRRRTSLGRMIPGLAIPDPRSRPGPAGARARPAGPRVPSGDLRCGSVACWLSLASRRRPACSRARPRTTCRTSRASPPTAGRCAQACSMRHCRARGRMGATSSAMPWRAGRQRCWPGQARRGPRACRPGPWSWTRSRAARWPAWPRSMRVRNRAPSSPSPAPTARPAPPSSCASSGPVRRARRQPGHPGPDRPRRCQRPRPDHAGPGGAGGHARRPRAGWRAGGGDGGVLARAGPVPAGWGAPRRCRVQQPDAGPPGLPRHDGRLPDREAAAVPGRAARRRARGRLRRPGGGVAGRLAHVARLPAAHRGRGRRPDTPAARRGHAGRPGAGAGAGGVRREVRLPLPGGSRPTTQCWPPALALVTGADAAIDLLPGLRGVRGRMELAVTLPNGAAVYVDYAHTPDALDRLLRALRPHTQGRLHVVFGAGGDRDPGKRPLMGAAAAARADVQW